VFDRVHAPHQRVDAVFRFVRAVTAQVRRQRQAHVQDVAVADAVAQAQGDASAAGINRLGFFGPLAGLAVITDDGRLRGQRDALAAAAVLFGFANWRRGDAQLQSARRRYRLGNRRRRSVIHQWAGGSDDYEAVIFDAL